MKGMDGDMVHWGGPGMTLFRRSWGSGICGALLLWSVAGCGGHEGDSFAHGDPEGQQTPPPVAGSETPETSPAVSPEVSPPPTSPSPTSPPASASPDMSSPTEAPTPVTLTMPLPYLSDYGFFVGDMAALQPAERVYPYQVISPLFSDFAHKERFIYLPEGAKITFSAEGNWEFPDGTILIKNFAFFDDIAYPEGGYTLIETRLLYKEEGVWAPITYIWNEDQTEAFGEILGADTVVHYYDEDGLMVDQPYSIPNVNQCRNCHTSSDVVIPIGVRTWQLNRDIPAGEGKVNQLEHFAALGFFTEALPPVDSLLTLPDPAGSASTEARARSYLEANCAHCHRSGGAAAASGLVLTWTEMVPYNFGVCRRPVATGVASGDLSWDIKPRASAESILVYRMGNLDPEVHMPELGNLVVDPFGMSLVSDWIQTMPTDPYADCLQ